MKKLATITCCAPGAPPLKPKEFESLSARFKALADPTRLAIVNRLASRDEACVCEFNSLGLSQPTISHHLKVLREAGLIEVSLQARDLLLLPARARGGRGARLRARRRAAAGARPRDRGGDRCRLRRVLFVCIGNAGRSQMAQAFAERAGFEVRSAGSRAESELHPEVVEAMRELGIDLERPRSAPADGRGRRVGGPRRDDGLRRRLPGPARASATSTGTCRTRPGCRSRSCARSATGSPASSTSCPSSRARAASRRPRRAGSRGRAPTASAVRAARASWCDPTACSSSARTPGLERRGALLDQPQAQMDVAEQPALLGRA